MNSENYIMQFSPQEFVNYISRRQAVNRMGNTVSLTGAWVNDIFVDGDVFIRDQEFYLQGFNNCKMNSLSIENCKFFNDFHLYNLEIVHELYIKRPNLIQNLVIGEIGSKNSSHINSIRIDGGSAAKSLIIQNLTIKEDLILTDFSAGNDILVTDCSVDGRFGVSNLICQNQIRILRGQVNCLQIEFIEDKSYLKITGISFKSILLMGCANLGYMQWNGLKPQPGSKISILNSIMGKWDIVNCDFSKVDMEIYSSKITDAFYTNTIFPELLCVPATITGETVQTVLRDGYNQLKTIAQKQNDRKLYLHYQAAELRSYKSTLKLWHDWKTIFQLWAMKTSNEYGTSWWKGVKFVVVCNLFFVILCFGFRPIQLDCIGIGNFVGLFLSSLSSLIALPKLISTTSNWEMNWFYVSRIPLAFGIYQTIAAFRKFGKSE